MAECSTSPGISYTYATISEISKKHRFWCGKTQIFRWDDDAKSDPAHFRYWEDTIKYWQRLNPKTVVISDYAKSCLNRKDLLDALPKVPVFVDTKISYPQEYASDR